MCPRLSAPVGTGRHRERKAGRDMAPDHMYLLTAASRRTSAVTVSTVVQFVPSVATMTDAPQPLQVIDHIQQMFESGGHPTPLCRWISRARTKERLLEPRGEVARGRLGTQRANVPRCLIGIEAGMATHYVTRELPALGHDVRQVPPASSPLAPGLRPEGFRAHEHHARCLRCHVPETSRRSRPRR